jgi:hypothetical protein
MKLSAILLIVLGLLSTSRISTASTPRSQQAIDDWAEALNIHHPWADLSDNAIHRHRGALAHVVHKMQTADIPDDTRAHLHTDLDRLLALEEADFFTHGQAFTKRPHST